MTTDSISIIIVEDHSIIVEGVSSILNNTPGLQLDGTFAAAEDVLHFLKKNKIDLVLLDIGLPGISGLELCGLIKSQNRDIKVIALTNHTEKSVIQEMLEKGADGYLLKNTSKRDLVAAIFQVMKNQFTMQSELQKILFAPAPAAKKVPRLTSREKEILELVSTGTTTNAIAGKLFISPQTVETHRRNLMQKFEVNNSLALIKKAREAGLL